MLTNSTDSKQSTCASVFKAIWSFIYIIIQIITVAGATIQIILSSGFLLAITIVAIFIDYKVHSIRNFLDDFTGLNIGAQINREFDVFFILIVFMLVLFACSLCYLSWILCKGLFEGKEEYIMMYICSGAVFLGIRVYFNINSYKYQNFPEDRTLLYCGLYGLYLLLLVITCFKIRRTRRALAEVAAALIQLSKN